MARIVAIVGISGAIGSAIAGALASSSETTVIGFGRSDVADKNLFPYMYKQLDFSNPKDISEASDYLSKQTFDRIDFVHAAGFFSRYQTFLEQSVEDISQSISANYISLALAIKTWLPLAVKVRNGHFVAFSSVAVRENFPFLATYTSVKAATESLIRSVSNEILIDNVTLNCLRLPTVRTPAEVRLKPHADIVHWLSPEQVAAATIHHFDGPNKPRGAALPIYTPSDTYFGESPLTRFGKAKSDLIS